MNFIKYIENYKLNEQNFKKTIVDFIEIDNRKYKRFTNEYWTSKQRQGNSIHEVSYRACFKAELPNFFITKLTKENDFVYDPFSGRGTTALEAALLNRRIIANDINPLSKILCEARLYVPEIKDLENRLNEIDFNKKYSSNTDLSMFYHPDTLSEILALKNYLIEKNNDNKDDNLDRWIRMVATNRLTGHSKGFFSVYTLPPNQAVTADRQLKINEKRNQTPDYRNVKNLILKKTKSLIRKLNEGEIKSLRNAGKTSLFISEDARNTPQIKNNTVQLTVTSPPFLNVVQYANDNWLRCFFNDIDAKLIEKKISTPRKIEEWTKIMQDVFHELFRITKKGGYVAFEVGEVKNGKIKLDEHVISIGNNAGFNFQAVLINEQIFTKTANIWGVDNNKKGTNSNRIVLFKKI